MSRARRPSAIGDRRQRIGHEKAARRAQHRVVGMHQRPRRRAGEEVADHHSSGAPERTRRARPGTCCRCRRGRAPASHRRSRLRAAAPADRRCGAGRPSRRETRRGSPIARSRSRWRTLYRPLSRQPPAVRFAAARGASEDEATANGSSPQTSICASSGYCGDDPLVLGQDRVDPGRGGAALGQFLDDPREEAEPALQRRRTSAAARCAGCRPRDIRRSSRPAVAAPRRRPARARRGAGSAPARAPAVRALRREGCCHRRMDRPGRTSWVLLESPEKAYARRCIGEGAGTRGHRGNVHTDRRSARLLTAEAGRRGHPGSPDRWPTLPNFGAAEATGWLFLQLVRPAPEPPR